MFAEEGQAIQPKEVPQQALHPTDSESPDSEYGDGEAGQGSPGFAAGADTASMGGELAAVSILSYEADETDTVPVHDAAQHDKQAAEIWPEAGTDTVTETTAVSLEM